MRNPRCGDLAGALLFLILGGSGCADLLGPRAGARLERAVAERARSCDDGHAAVIAALLRPGWVGRVEPLTNVERTPGGPAGVTRRVTGARLIGSTSLPPLTVARALRCHQAARALGLPDEPAPALDPYALPDGWVDAEVSGDRGSVSIVLRGNRWADVPRILDGALALSRR